MQLVEQHRIDRQDPRWKAIDDAAFTSKNLYNAALYMMRQLFTRAAVLLSYEELDIIMQPEPPYQALPAKVAQWVLKQVHNGWKSYFHACAEYRAHPNKFKGHPRLPGYLDKHGRNVVVYTSQAISRAKKNSGWVMPSGVAIQVATKHTPAEIAQVRLVPKATHYVVEVVYEQPLAPQPVDPDRIASIDLGVNNLAAITSNKQGFVPRLVSGRPLKSVNQSYNQQRE